MNHGVLLIIIAVTAIWVVSKSLTRASSDKIHEFMRRGALVIDVRTAAEYEAGHLNSAINIPLDQLNSRIREIEPDPNRPILLHCESGARSEAAVQILRKMGYQHVLNVGSFARARSMLEPSR